MKSNKWGCLLICGILFISFFIHINLINGSQNSSNSLRISQISSDNSSVPYLQLSSDTVQAGDDLQIFYGMNASKTFISGYNYTLFLTNQKLNQSAVNLFLQYYFVNNTIILPNNQTYLPNFNYSIIITGKTENQASTYRLKTLNENSILQPNSYSVIFIANSSLRGPFNETQYFNIVIIPGASLNLSVYDPQTNAFTDNIITEINQVRNLQVIVSNVGNKNAFNISVTLSPTNEPVGLKINSSLILFEPILVSFNRTIFNFSVTPDRFGVGKLQINMVYEDGIEAHYDIKVLTLNTLPDIQGSVILPKNIVINTVSEFGVNLVNTEQQNVSLVVSLDSPDFSFSPTEYRFTILPYEVKIIYFKGNAIGNGSSSLTLHVTFLDSDGLDSYALIKSSFYVSIENQTLKPPNTDNYLPYLIGIIIFNLLILAIILFLYFREDLRFRVLNKLMGLNLNPDLNFTKNSIIIDGSNIAWEEVDISGRPQIKNILNSIEILKLYGFKDIIVVADAALRYQIENKKELDQQVQSGIIKVLPAKVDGDQFILRLSNQTGAYILTNDLFREFRDEYEWIDKRRIPFSIINGNIFLHPPYELEEEEHMDNLNIKDIN